jgi:hypothetical protein
MDQSSSMQGSIRPGKYFSASFCTHYSNDHNQKSRRDISDEREREKREQRVMKETEEHLKYASTSKKKENKHKNA